MSEHAAAKVTVICIAYNHAPWIEEALESVRAQDYPTVELIVVDNGSTDGTEAKVRAWIDHHSGQLPIKAIFNDKPEAYCKLFNRVLAKVDCPFVVDLSGDDVLYPQHLSASIRALEASPGAGFVFSDAQILDHRGQLKSFYKRDKAGVLVEEADLNRMYVTLIARSYICSPTVVFNAAVLRKEGGYDESLFYEDFDIQLRLARSYPVVFSDHFGVIKRLHADSMSAAQYRPRQSRMLPSTVKICSKILQMNESAEENAALGVRICYELKHALWSANFGPARKLIELGEQLGLRSLEFRLYKIWAKGAFDISWLYLKLR